MWRMFLVALALVACSKKAPPPAAEEPSDDYIANFKHHVDEVCACKDNACIGQSNAKYSNVVEAWAKRVGSSLPPPSQAQQDEAKLLGDRMRDCVVKVDPSMKNVAPPFSIVVPPKK